MFSNGPGMSLPFAALERTSQVLKLFEERLSQEQCLGCERAGGKFFFFFLKWLFTVFFSPSTRKGKRESFSFVVLEILFTVRNVRMFFFFFFLNNFWG